MVAYDQDDSARRLTCRFSGELRNNECEVLQDQVALHLSSFLAEHAVGTTPAPRVVFDLEKVTFASSSFIRIVLSCMQRVGREPFSVVHANAFLTGLFRTVGLQDVLKA